MIATRSDSLLPSKSTEHLYASKWLAGNTELSGHEEIILRSDNEPAMLKMKNQVMDRIEGIRFVPEEKPSKDPKDNPDAESANNIAEDLIRCHKTQLDEGIGDKLPSDHPTVAWLVSHCGVLYNTSHMGADGLTPFERARGRRTGKLLCMFGETVFYKPVIAGRSKAAKIKEKFVDGIFLGLVQRTGEIIVGTIDGRAECCRDFRRRSPDKRWSRDLVFGIKALPWALSGIADGSAEVGDDRLQRATTRLEAAIAPKVPTGGLPPVPNVEYKARQLYVTARLIAKFGRTKDCAACDGRASAQ